MSLHATSLNFSPYLLRLHILMAWDELDQRVIDTAVKQWRMHLGACVKVKGGHIEHRLSQ